MARNMQLFEFLNGAKLELFTYQEDNFFSKSISAQIEFNKEKKDDVNSLTIIQDGKKEFIKLK